MRAQIWLISSHNGDGGDGVDGGDGGNCDDGGDDDDGGDEKGVYGLNSDLGTIRASISALGGKLDWL